MVEGAGSAVVGVFVVAEVAVMVLVAVAVVDASGVVGMVGSPK